MLFSIPYSKYQESYTAVISFVGYFCLVRPPLRRHHLSTMCFISAFDILIFFSPPHECALNSPHGPCTAVLLALIQQAGPSLLCLCTVAPLLVSFCLQLVYRIHSIFYSMADKTSLSAPRFPFQVAPISLTAQLYTAYLTTFNMQGSFLCLCFCLHDNPKSGCMFPFFG